MNSKIFNIYDDFGINDAGNEDKIAAVLENVKIGECTSVLLNLTRCIIDYPATSMLIDKILFQLAALEGEKEIDIHVSYFLPEQTLINDLLGDSKFFEIETQKEIPLLVIQKKINDKLIPNNIKLDVKIIDRIGTNRQTFEYGRN